MTRPASPHPDADRLVCSLVWRRADGPSLEHFRLWAGAGGARLAGSVVGVLDSMPASVEYEVTCAPDWTTRRAVVTAVVVGVTHRVELVADDQRRWWRDGRELPALAGCADVDIAVTPSTNTLPIRRLALDVGEARDVTAVWVRVGPGLAVEPLPQRYTRLAGGQYRYESNGGAFTATIDVDDDGVVVRYPPAWERAPLGPPREG